MTDTDQQATDRKDELPDIDLGPCPVTGEWCPCEMKARCLPGGSQAIRDEGIRWGAAIERESIADYMERHGGQPAGLLAQEIREERHHD
jgi:hypothetical protein